MLNVLKSYSDKLSFFTYNISKNEVNREWAWGDSEITFDPQEDLWLIVKGKTERIVSIKLLQFKSQDFKSLIIDFIEQSIPEVKLLDLQSQAQETNNDASIHIRKIQDVLNSNNVYLQASIEKSLSNPQPLIVESPSDIINVQQANNSSLSDDDLGKADL